MKKTYATLILALMASFTFGQQLIPESLTTTEHNEWGDPITNVIDMNGAQQGDWFYEDIYGNLLLKEHYVDHVLQEVYFATFQSDGTVSWEVSTQWITSDDLTTKLREKIVETHGAFGSDQQLAIFFNTNGELVRFAPLGNMNEVEAEAIEQTVLEFLENNQISLSDETVILL